MVYVWAHGDCFLRADVHVTDGQCSPVVCQHYRPERTTVDMGLLPADRRRRCECTLKQAGDVDRRGRLANGEGYLLLGDVHQR